MARFAGLNAQVLGISVDPVPSLQAWAESLGGINYPLLSDFWPHGAVSARYGVLRPEGNAERALFILDREGVIRYVDVHDFNEQPSNDVLLEELRRIDPEAAANEPPEPPEPEPVELPHGGVVMYCSAWCPDCKRLRTWFKAHDIAYTEVDVNAVPGAAAQVRAWADGKLVTPTFDVDGLILPNAGEAKLAEVLGVR
jgi:glutaredoxin